MNEHRFIELLAAYGAELSRWPVEERAAAEELLEFGSHRLKDLWESERVFDRLLALEKDRPTSINLESRVLTAAPKRAVRKTGLGWRMPQWAAGGAVAASLALGFAAGYAGEPVQPSSNAPSALAMAQGGSAPVLLNAEVGTN